ncbi:hypothetical protein FSP39_002854 [Pinctada imbricata]|uniref:DNA polymerase alpha/delta/epsilon subunit B domain-containing protein n=1 Tax=Pinctada imbricata TaxID=66713 RepID=A0AA88Y4J1_PINIB|nr:hypothetical protein FSP39_002854 [Pinctada imbricata]
MYSSLPDPVKVGKLLSDPNNEYEEKYERVQSNYTNLSKKFRLTERNFGRQYAHLYAERLWTMRAKVVKSAKSKWGYVLGTSGQPVEDIIRYSSNEDAVDILQKCMDWGHIAPTAPDTLSCYPYYKEDPFILGDCPHIFFAGNQSKFSSKIYKGPKGQEVLLISIPKFVDTKTCVLVNLRSLECQPMQFQTDFTGMDSESPEVDK